MAVDVIIEAPEWDALGLEPLADRAEGTILRHLGLDPAAFEVVILACDDARIAALNADFRGKPRPTNVLSWPSEERGAEVDGGTPEQPEPGELGDIALAYGVCLKEAEQAGKPMADHVTHLILHGVLHLLGYDHESDADAELMERMEIEALATLGLDNPY